MGLPSYLIGANMMEKQAAGGDQSSTARNSYTIILEGFFLIRHPNWLETQSDAATFSFNQKGR